MCVSAWSLHIYSHLCKVHPFNVRTYCAQSAFPNFFKVTVSLQILSVLFFKMSSYTIDIFLTEPHALFLSLLYRSPATSTRSTTGEATVDISDPEVRTWPATSTHLVWYGGKASVDISDPEVRTWPTITSTHLVWYGSKASVDISDPEVRKWPSTTSTYILGMVWWQG